MHGKRVPMEGIPGSPPDLRDLPSGCAFHPRCRWALDRCKLEDPALSTVGGSSRQVACWLHRDGATPPPELSLPEPADVLRERLMQVKTQ
jgi:peptide/nickel transport system ATP-binding protein